MQEHKRYRVARVSRRAVFGDPQRLELLLEASPCSHTINTSYVVARHNGTLRHLDARCHRKTYRFSKGKRNHQHQLVLSLGYYHLCREHRPLTKQHQQPTTPFMSTGLANHVWTMRQLLECRTE